MQLLFELKQYFMAVKPLCQLITDYVREAQ